jgi:hypothetical protein
MQAEALGCCDTGALGQRWRSELAAGKASRFWICRYRRVLPSI